MGVRVSVALSRGSERGAAIFIVVLVLTMLAAIGIFAMRASSLSGAASGYERQTVQNQAVAEYGILAVTAELGTSRRSAYIRMTQTGSDKCLTQQGMYGDGGTTVPCYRVYDRDLAENGVVAFQPATGGDGGAEPGSFGPGEWNITGEFCVEMTEPGAVAEPMPGDPLGRSKSRQVTLTSMGQVRPTGLADEATGVVTGNATSRAYVVVPE
jgi:hypothetical protein